MIILWYADNINERTNVPASVREDTLKKGTVKIVLTAMTAAGIAASGVWYVFFSPYFDSSSLFSEELIPTGITIEKKPDPTVTDVLPSVFVHVCGEVINPGVYEIPLGSRVVDAVNRAGGFSDNANEDYLNLARVVADSERIYVPAKEEEVEMQEGENSSEKININTATVEELSTLPGIGESRAKDIISYRTNVGKFEKIDDIKNVSGIGEAMFMRLKGYITVR